MACLLRSGPVLPVLPALKCIAACELLSGQRFLCSSPAFMSLVSSCTTECKQASPVIFNLTVSQSGTYPTVQAVISVHLKKSHTKHMAVFSFALCISTA